MVCFVCVVVDCEKEEGVLFWKEEGGGVTPKREKMQILDHNLKAYKALIKSFKKANRACIVHPTGLGKSYIAYQLIADNPDSTFLVLLVWYLP